MTLKCIVVDDEPRAREILKGYIDRMNSLSLVAECEGAMDAFKVLQQHKIDLIFLDMQMPGLNGLEFLKALKNPPRAIVTTAYRDYALKGYEMDVVDYLLKPFSFDRLFKAVDKVYTTIGTESNSITQRDFVYLRVDKKVLKVSLKDILYIESLKDYIRVKTPQKEIISHQKISYMEENLPSSQFLRVHRSYIISLCNIEAYSVTNVELGGFSVPIGRNYKKSVIPFLNQRIL